MDDANNRVTNARDDRLRLVGFMAVLILAGVGLAGVAGPPRLPEMLPRWTDVAAVLVGSTLAIEPVALVLLDAAWLLWMWLSASLVLELALVTLELLAYGAAWVYSLRRVADRLSMPLVRRAVAAAFAVQVLSRA